MTKKLMAMVLFLLALVTLAGAAARAQDDIGEHRECSLCGMDRKAYGYSRMLVSYSDGPRVGVCSLHCAVAEMDGNEGREVASLQVADRDTRQLIDAEKAVWVMGGSKRGVMTQRPKWAFATREAAQKFIAANGGAIVGWDEALASARQDAAPKPRRPGAVPRGD